MAIILRPNIHWDFRVIEKLNGFVILMNAYLTLSIGFPFIGFAI